MTPGHSRSIQSIELTKILWDWSVLDMTLKYPWDNLGLCVKVTEQKGSYNEYAIRHLRATRNGETREVTHIHYMEFPDRGTPKCVPSLLDMIELMRAIQPANSPDAPPVVIHCRQVYRHVYHTDWLKRYVICWLFLSTSLYVSKRGAYWDRLCRDVVGWLVVGWLVGWLSRACTVAKRCILGL